MIKKILTALLLCLIGLSSYGDAKPKYDFVKGDNQLSLKAQRTTRVLQKYFPNEIDRENVINTILGFVRERPTSKTSGWIDIDQIETLCTNGGYDLTKSEDQKKCINFVRAFVALTLDDYYEVCGKGAHVKGITAHCIDNVFYHENTLADTQVTMLEATGLAKEYVRINANKYNNDVIECSDKYRDDGALIAPDYFIKCRSVTEPIYYEFKFDDVEEHMDDSADASLGAAICSLHGEEYTGQRTTHAAYDVKGRQIREYEHVPAHCNTADSSKCKLINVTANKFARKTIFKNGTCFIEQRDSLDVNNLRTAFGIDNKHFRNGIQMMSSANMEETLCEYIMNAANTTITDCFCDSSKQRVFYFSGGITEPDDVYTCFANNEPIDFLFDDLNEGNKTLQQGGLEAFNCSRLGGEYQGKTCYVPNAELCKKIADATIADCPECAKAYYDETLKSCVLPNATKANEHQKKVNIGLIIGGAVVGAVIIIYTGGTGFSAVAITLETIGAGMELGSQMHIDGVADEFFMKANNCNAADCAERILKEFFQYLSRMTNDLRDGELNGIESQMVRLIGLLPDDSQFLIDIVAGCYEENGDNFDISKCDDGVWNNDQIIRAVGIGLQFTSVFASVGKWLLGAGRVQKIASKTPRLAEALGTKIPGIKGKIAQNLSKGEKVLTSDGKAIKADGAVKICREKGFNVELDEKGVIRFLDTPSDDLMSSYVNDIARKYNKQAEFRSGVSNSLGHDYYRIMVNDDNVAVGIVADLRRNGYFVSSNQTNGGAKFIAVSKENVFHKWENAPTNWLKNVEIYVSDYVNYIARKYNKQAVLRFGASNSLGHDYYRIVIDDNDNVLALIEDLQRNGFFVSANQTVDGTKFIGASKENIFQKWTDAPTNWLRGYSGGSIRGRGIFDKVYNDMPDDVLARKLEYIYSVERNGGSDHDIVEAMKAVGAFDERQAGLLAQDIADETIRRISENPDLVRIGKNWSNLSEYERKQFVIEVHNIVTQERRARVGDTMIFFDNSNPNNRGWHRRPSAGSSRAFSYNIDNYTDAGDALKTIIHENIHSFQSVNKSSIPEPLVKLSQQHYVQPKDNYTDYRNVLIEIEARYVADNAAPIIARNLGW